MGLHWRMKPAYDGYHGNSFITQVGRWLFNARLVRLEPEVVALTKEVAACTAKPIYNRHHGTGILWHGTVPTLVHLFSMCEGWWLSVVRRAGGCLAVVWRLLLSGQNTDSSSQGPWVQFTPTADDDWSIQSKRQQTQVGIRQPSFMQEPTEKVYKHKTPQFTRKISLVPRLQFLITCSWRRPGNEARKDGFDLLKFCLKYLQSTILSFYFWFTS